MNKKKTAKAVARYNDVLASLKANNSDDQFMTLIAWSIIVDVYRASLEEHQKDFEEIVAHVKELMKPEAEA